MTALRFGEHLALSGVRRVLPVRTGDWEVRRDDKIPVQCKVICDWFNEEVMFPIPMHLLWGAAVLFDVH